jgi:hypothetical protein
MEAEVWFDEKKMCQVEDPGDEEFDPQGTLSDNHCRTSRACTTCRLRIWIYQTVLPTNQMEFCFLIFFSILTSLISTNNTA